MMLTWAPRLKVPRVVRLNFLSFDYWVHVNGIAY